jgi:hypothetical protein
LSDLAASGTLPVPYAAIGLLFQQQNLTLFLGAAASSVMAAPIGVASLDKAATWALPNAQQFSADLAKLANYPTGQNNDSLTKVSQYLVEYAGDRDLILSYIKARFHDTVPADYRCSVTDFLGEIPSNYIPKLIVSTNYDTLIERLLERRSIPYICVSHVLGRSKYSGRLIVYEKLGTFSKDLIMTRAELEELLIDRLDTHDAPVILYKMHGSATSFVPRKDRDDVFAGGVNSVVITEQDYIDYLDKDTMGRLPIQMREMLRKSQFLFLGYSLSDWNFRLLLHRLRESQAGADTKHYACLLHSDPVESLFWQKRGVNIHYVSLDQFLDDLKQNLGIAS